MEACLLHSWQVQGNACTLLYPTLRLSQWTFGWIKLWKDRVFNFVQYSQIRWPRTVTAKPNTSQQKQSSFGFAVGICFFREVFGFCCEVFGFAVRYLVFAVKYLVLPWGLWFCREVFLFLPWGFWFCRDVFVFWGFRFCRVRYFVFAVRFSVLPWSILFLPWGFCFCRDSCGPPYVAGWKGRGRKERASAPPACTFLACLFVSCTNYFQAPAWMLKLVEWRKSLLHIIKLKTFPVEKSATRGSWFDSIVPQAIPLLSKTSKAQSQGGPLSSVPIGCNPSAPSSLRGYQWG